MNKKEIQKPKGKSAIKLLSFSLILFFINAGSTKAQVWLEGDYENKVGLNFRDVYTYYTFNKGGTFEFHQGGHECNGDCQYATGTYQIQDSLLLIKYTTEQLLISNIEKREWKEISDSITVRVKINNIKEVCGVPCISVKFNGKLYHQNRDYGIELRFKKQQNPIEMAALAIGYHIVNLAFAGDISSEASFNLKLFQAMPLSGFTRKAKILTVKDGLVTAIEFEDGAKIFLQE